MNKVFTSKFSWKKLTSPCLVQTILTRFRIPNLHSQRFPNTEALGPLATTASTPSFAMCDLTGNRVICSEVRLTAGDKLLLRFPSSLAN